jgi:hypothetical protein
MDGLVAALGALKLPVKVHPWNNNAIQYPRLIAELQMAGAFTSAMMRELCRSMDLDAEDLEELVNRACVEWDQIVANTNPPRNQSMRRNFGTLYGRRKKK